MLNNDQIETAKALAASRPVLIVETYKDGASFGRWLTAVTDSMKALQVTSLANIAEFCKIAGAPANVPPSI